ncbi:hypothetical protein HD806DRAFT_4004 [Xylariaceae sp. AK1471]|nr:hypothetical protein HD806DRAFT_4004 [Xylariaceae sp. AK1471]
MAVGSASVPPATYELIQTWIGQQRQTPIPLTEELRNAVLNLESALKAVPAPQPEPELGESNWVGLLMEYQAARPYNGSRKVNFDESSYDPAGRGILRWKCQVTIPEHPGALFPGAAGGLHADGSQPTFARKKDAKKYAAKCAVEWLRAKGLMPHDGGVRFPKATTTTTTTTQQPQFQPQTQQPRASSSSSFLGQEEQTTYASTNAVPSSPFDDTQPSATHQVSQLCDSLGLPAPTYRLEPMSAGGEFWRGRADFGVYSATLPFDVSRLVRVESVLGKRAAKENIAEDLLKYLREEKRTREIGDREFLARVRGGSGGGGKERGGGMREG